MKRDHINYLTVGTFVVLMIATFFVAMYFITGRTGPSDEYFLEYENVSGLKFGTGVFYEGYRVGQVDEISPEASTDGMRYRLRISVRRGWKIPDDSVARVASSGLISAMQIGIEEGDSSTYLAPGDFILSAEQANIFSVLNKTASEFQHLSRAGVMPLLENLNARVTEISDEVLAFRQKELQPFMESFNRQINQEILVDAQKLIGRLDHSAEQLQDVLGETNRAHFTSFLSHIDDVAINLNDLISRIEQTRIQMSGVLTAIDDLTTGNKEMVSTTLSDAGASMKEVRLMLTTINKNLDSIMYHAEGSSRHMHEFTKALRDNPSRLIRGSNSSGVSE